MRILSQDGTRDVPYEQVAVIQDARDKRKIVATGVNAEGAYSFFPMAEYSTEAKAKRAMEMLHEAYKLYVMYKTMSVQEKELFLKSQSEKERENVCGVFQFPSDDELED